MQQAQPNEELYLSFERSYFSIDDILAGFLDPSLDRPNLPTGTTLELPAWAVHCMTRVGREYVTVETPSKYKKPYRDIIKAEPSILDLNKWGPYYYRSGIFTVSLPVPDRLAIREILLYLFRKRIQRLSLTYSYTTKLHSVNESNVQYRAGNVLREHCMDNLELRIYRDAQKGAIPFRTWMETPSRPLL